MNQNKNQTPIEGKNEKVFEQILGSECKKCIQLFGFNEKRCAFCKNNEYYRDYIIDVLKN